MAASRGGEDLDRWLERTVHDPSNVLSADDLEKLRSGYGDASVELVEKTLASTYSTDFENASDEQIIAVVGELVTSSASGMAAAEPPDTARDFTHHPTRSSSPPW